MSSRDPMNVPAALRLFSVKVLEHLRANIDTQAAEIKKKVAEEEGGGRGGGSKEDGRASSSCACCIRAAPTASAPSATSRRQGTWRPSKGHSCSNRSVHCCATTPTTRKTQEQAEEEIRRREASTAGTDESGSVRCDSTLLPVGVGVLRHQPGFHSSSMAARLLGAVLCGDWLARGLSGRARNSRGAPERPPRGTGAAATAALPARNARELTNTNLTDH